MIKKSRKSPYPFWLTIPSLIVYSVFVIVPILMGLYLSFTNWNYRRWSTPELIGIGNYISILKDEIFILSMRNTFIFAFGSTFLKIAAGLILALLLVKPFKGNSIFRTIFYMPCVLSCTVIGVLFTAILASNGLVNNMLEFLHLGMLTDEWLGSYGTAMFWVVLIEGWMWAGFNMFIFIAGLQAIPRDYYEAAQTEGAGWFKQFMKITLPLLIPAFTVNITLNIAGGMKVFDIIYVLTHGGPGFDTQVLTTYAFKSFGMGYLGESSAASIVLTFLVIIVSLTLNKFFRKREVEL